jgi:hypothetical protein
LLIQEPNRRLNIVWQTDMIIKEVT